MTIDHIEKLILVMAVLFLLWQRRTKMVSLCSNTPIKSITVEARNADEIAEILELFRQHEDLTVLKSLSDAIGTANSVEESKQVEEEEPPLDWEFS